MKIQTFQPLRKIILGSSTPKLLNKAVIASSAFSCAAKKLKYETYIMNKKFNYTIKQGTEVVLLNHMALQKKVFLSTKEDWEFNEDDLFFCADSSSKSDVAILMLNDEADLVLRVSDLLRSEANNS